MVEKNPVAELMTFVLSNVEPAGDLDPLPAINAYVAQHSDRPATRAAIEEQIATFHENTAKHENVAEGDMP